MTETEIVQSLHSASALYTNKILKQHWKQMKYSYMETPRPDYGLILLLFGRVDFVSEKQTVHASVGDVVFLPKDCYYEARISDRAEDYLICFDMQGAEISLDAPMLLFKNASFACKDAFRALAEEGYSGNAQGFKAKGLFYLLLSAISEEVQAERSPQARLVQNACSLMQENASLSMAAVAKQCAVSQSGLRRIFKQYMDQTPVQYRMRVRLKRAVYLLESSDLSVEEIAARLDFFDAAYFCKVFREEFGVTPGEYRKNKRL